MELRDSVTKENLLRAFAGESQARNRYTFSAATAKKNSMEVLQLYWWKHNCRSGQYASAKVHRLLHVEKKVDFPRDVEDYTITCDELPGLEVEVYSEY